MSFSYAIDELPLIIDGNDTGAVIGGDQVMIEISWNRMRDGWDVEKIVLCGARVDNHPACRLLVNSVNHYVDVNREMMVDQTGLGDIWDGE